MAEGSLSEGTEWEVFLTVWPRSKSGHILEPQILTCKMRLVVFAFNVKAG